MPATLQTKSSVSDLSVHVPDYIDHVTLAAQAATTWTVPSRITTVAFSANGGFAIANDAITTTTPDDGLSETTGESMQYIPSSVFYEVDSGEVINLYNPSATATIFITMGCYS